MKKQRNKKKTPKDNKKKQKKTNIYRNELFATALFLTLYWTFSEKMVVCRAKPPAHVAMLKKIVHMKSLPGRSTVQTNAITFSREKL